MKGLDTPALLALLEGRPETRSMLDDLGGEELCTTEVNLFELEAIARSGPSPGRARRLAALDRLRRKVTVLPVDERGARAAAAIAAANRVVLSGSTWLVVGTLWASGAGEVLTTPSSGLPALKLPVKVISVRRKRSKAR